MRGTDCTTEQIASAREFVWLRQTIPHASCPGDEQMVTLPFGHLARVVAWYGALRYIAGRDGTGGSLEKPGEMVVPLVRQPAQQHEER